MRTQRPNPTKRLNNMMIQYVAHIQTGSASFIPPLTDEALGSYTEQVKSTRLIAMKSWTQFGRHPAAIQHVLYIVKENRSYDQVLGDIGKGDSDPALCLFKENVSPNHHKLAREFVLFDNFYVNSDVSADGTTGRRRPSRTILCEAVARQLRAAQPQLRFRGRRARAYPPAGYLWTNAASAGVSMRNYGYWVENKKEPGADGVQIDKVLDPVLAKVTNTKYRSFDLDYPDVKRAQTFWTIWRSLKAPTRCHR